MSSFSEKLFGYRQLGPLRSPDETRDIAFGMTRKSFQEFVQRLLTKDSGEMIDCVQDVDTAYERRKPAGYNLDWMAGRYLDSGGPLRSNRVQG